MTFPAELEARPQWVVRRADKLPLNPRTGTLASVTDPTTWADYQTAMLACRAHNVELGFVLTTTDPYTVIDLDPTHVPSVKANHVEIFDSFNTYAELSPSGNGVHIWCRGRIPQGTRFPEYKIEVYSSGRYMTVTGKTLKNLPINDCQALLTDLYTQVKKAQGANDHCFQEIVASLPDAETDEKVYEIAASAANGDKFLRLWTGDWRGLYASQSEADFSLINMLAYYTDSKEQVMRLFRASNLGKRDKARRDNYVLPMVKRSFDRKLPVIDLVARSSPKKKIIEPVQQDIVPIPALDVDWMIPPGIVGQIVEYIYQSAVRPVKEVALAAAIAYYAGIVGRAYNVSGTGLNQYVVILAKTGIGKEAASSGISRLNTALTALYPAASMVIGPANIASAQGLLKYLAKTSPCIVSQMGEIGLWLQNICSANARTNEIGIRRALLDLFNKSGRGDIVNSYIYSDAAKDIPPIYHPSFSLIGDSTPDAFYRAVDSASITDGFLPRFTIIEYHGLRPPRNKYHTEIKPKDALIDSLVGSMQAAKTYENRNEFVNVQLSPEAEKFADEFDEYCTDVINSSDDEFIIGLWNRGHLRILKLAALLAVGVNPDQPEIGMLEIQWAHTLVLRGINTMLKRFMSGRIGEAAGHEDQQAAVTRSLYRYIATPYTMEWGKAHGFSAELHMARVVSYAYIQHQTRSLSCFRRSRQAATDLKIVIDEMIRMGVLSRHVDGVKRQYGELLAIHNLGD